MPKAPQPLKVVVASQTLPSNRPPKTQTAKPRPLELRVAALGELLAMVVPVEKTPLKSAARGLSVDVANSGGNNNVPTLMPRTCEDYGEVVKAWRNADMVWSMGLDNALLTMYASAYSTQFVGEQLWIKIEGPPSCGKTSLMEGLAVARKWYVSKDTIRGFHSGWRTADGSDASLVDRLRNMTLGIKDGDTLLKAPNLKQILAEGRALYDKVSRTHYRNEVEREYSGHRMTWHLAGTRALREIDESELGVRFLNVVVMDKIEDEFENAVGLRAAQQEARSMLIMSDGKPDTHYTRETCNAMALSGGFLDYLRTNAYELSKTVSIGNRELELIGRFGKFAAHMRVNLPSDNYRVPVVSREFSPRLVKQLTRLAISMAVVLGKAKVDGEVIERVRQVTLDTSRGATLELVNVLVDEYNGMECRGLAARLQVGDDRIRNQLRMLRVIGVVEVNKSGRRWRVRPNVTRLHREVTGA